MQVKANDDFLKSLSEAEWDEAEDLADLAHAVCKGLTEAAEFQFVQAGIERKRANPAAPGIELINAGLVAIGKPPIMPKRKGVSTRRSTLK